MSGDEEKGGKNFGNWEITKKYFWKGISLGGKSTVFLNLMDVKWSKERNGGVYMLRKL